MLYSKLWRDRHTRTPGACWPAGLQSTGKPQVPMKAPVYKKIGTSQGTTPEADLRSWNAWPHLHVHLLAYTHIHGHSHGTITSVISRSLVLGSQGLCCVQLLEQSESILTIQMNIPTLLHRRSWESIHLGQVNTVRYKSLEHNNPSVSHPKWTLNPCMKHH